MVKKRRKRGFIYVFTGEGAGKTVASLGLALRALGQGLRVVVIQFMKGRPDTGEYKIQKKLPKYEVYQFGRSGFVDVKNPSVEDIRLAQKGFLFTQKVFKKKKPYLLILDEINMAAAIGLLEIKKVVDFLESIPPEANVILTGQWAPKEFMELADGVTELKKVKHPFEKGIKARKGLEY